MLEDLSGIVEQRAVVIEDSLADEVSQRPAGSQLREVARHSSRDGVSLDARPGVGVRDERRGLRVTHRMDRQRGHPATQSRALAHERLHLGDVRTAEHELGL